jgi:Rieske Fe-S protein
MSDDLTRRQLVRRVAALGVAPVVGRALAGCARRIDPSRTVAVPAPVDGVIEAPLAQLSDLQREGGSVVLRPAGSVPGSFGRYPYPALVVTGHLGPPARYLAFNADCPHAGCDVTWVPKDAQVECPCHGSRFASDGRVLNPPARQDLTVLPIDVDALGVVRVQLLPGDGTFPPLQSGVITFRAADYPGLQQEGGLIEGRAGGYPYPIIVVRLGGAYRALSALCPHLGCTVLPSADGFRCPCHGSQFTLSGKLVLGPSQSDLGTLTIEEISPGVVRVTPPPF